MTCSGPRHRPSKNRTIRLSSSFSGAARAASLANALARSRFPILKKCSAAIRYTDASP